VVILLLKKVVLNLLLPQRELRTEVAQVAILEVVVVDLTPTPVIPEVEVMVAKLLVL